MPIICPTILADNMDGYRSQLEKVAHLGNRIQIDLTDSEFAKTKTVKPEEAWWPIGFAADLHLMYKDPMSAIKHVLEHKPNLIIIHAEASGNFDEVVTTCRQADVKVGVALMPATDPVHIIKSLDNIDHVLIFSGDLGSFGGHADLSLLSKVMVLKQHKPGLEVGWDGGVNLMNVAQLAAGGIDVLNVGGYIQNAPDPKKAYVDLVRIADETGTT